MSNLFLINNSSYIKACCEHRAKARFEKLYTEEITHLEKLGIIEYNENDRDYFKDKGVYFERFT